MTYRSSNDFDRSFDAANKRFNTMWKVVVGFIALTFIAMIVFAVLFFTGNLNMSYSYSYDYQVGDYRQSESYELNR